MNEGIQDLQKNWEDWETELKKGDKTTSDYVKTIRDLTKDIAKLIGHTEDLSLPQEFFDDAENLELIKKDIACLDYVIVHELSHFIEMNHSDRFWNVVGANYPNYKEVRRIMKNY